MVALGEDEPLASHALDSDIQALKKDSLMTSRVRNLFARRTCDGVEKFY